MNSIVVTAPVMIPNTPDCTYDQGEPVLKPEQIKEFQENYKKYKLIDMEHDFRDTYKTRGTVLKSWILDKPTSFLNFQGTQEIKYPKSTWMMTARIYDPTAVQLIQNGYLTGFSSSTINKSVADMRLKEAQKSKTLIKDIKDPVTYVVSLVHSPCLTQSKFCKCNFSADKSEKMEDKNMSNNETPNEDEKKKEEQKPSSEEEEKERDNDKTSSNTTEVPYDEKEKEEEEKEEEEEEEKTTSKKQPNNKEEANKSKRGYDKMDENSFFQKIKNLFEDTLNEREANKSTQTTQDPSKVQSKTEKKDKAEEPKQPTEPTTQSESSTKQLQTLIDNLQTELSSLKTQMGDIETRLDGFIKEGKSNKNEETPKTQPTNTNNNTNTTTKTDEKKKEEANKSKQVSSINDGFPNNSVQLNETQFIYQQMGRNTRGSKIREN